MYFMIAPFRPALMAAFTNWSIGRRENRHRSKKLFQFTQSAFKEAAFGLLTRQIEGALISLAGLGGFPEPPKKIRPGGVRKMVIEQFFPFVQIVDEGDSRRRSIAHGDRHRTIQLDDC